MKMQKSINSYGVFLGLLFSSCASLSHGSGDEDLQKSVETYHHAFRWRNYELASGYWPEKDRGLFVSAYEDDKNAIEVDSYRIVQVDRRSSKEARVLVQYMYTEWPDVVVQKKRVNEYWRQVEGRWILEKEEGALRNVYVDLEEDEVSKSE